jgi:hypothetical protein
MDQDQQFQHSHLFTIRLWTEQIGDGQVERRGRVQYVLSGERQHFRDWSTLVSYLEAKLQELDGGKTPSDLAR